MNPQPPELELSTPRPPTDNRGDNAVCETATTADTDDIWEQMRNNIRITTVV